MIESTLMKTEKGPGGLKGLTLKPEVVKKWAFSLDTFGKIDHHLNDYMDNEDADISSTRLHKEEQNFRIRKKIKRTYPSP